MRSFLFELCDYHLSYLGCKNKEPFTSTATSLLILSVLTSLGYFLYALIHILVEKSKRGKKVKEIWNDLDTVAVTGGMANVFRCFVLVNLRRASQFDVTAMTDAEAQIHVRTTIWFEHLQLVFAPVAMTLYINTIVKTATGANLYDPIKFGQRTVDIGKLIKLIRLTVLITNLVLVCLLSIVGVNGSLEEYILYKRLYYSFPGAVSLFISIPLLSVFGSKVVKALEGKHITSSEERNSSLHSGKIISTGQVLSSPMEPPKDSLVSKSKKSQDAQHKRQLRHWLLRATINVVIGMYVAICFIFGCWIILNEVYQSSEPMLYQAQVIVEYLFWVQATLYSI
ncbi:hypothetical protein EDD86DRAFT_262450 [Gorgonomyces haynaldii]|nr:hypothetical protein EDD86DRAFT_262450 [Gorgonomyces haynaldii]